MFDRMIKLLCVLSAALLAVACEQEKKDNDASQTEDASGVRSDAALKIAIYYVGDAKCRAQLEGRTEEHIAQVLQANNDAEYMEEGKNTHRLDGNGAELVSKEYRGKQENPMLGGDMFLQANDIARTLATLKDHCRHLLLSIDSEDMPRLSSDNLATDTEAVGSAARFTADFGDFGGKVTCGNGRRGNLSLCSFAQINDGKRYFAYLYPKPGEDTIAAEVTYMQQGKELTETITIEDIARDELQLPTTQLSDIVVNADCGEGNECLFAGTAIPHSIECKVEGEGCGNGFAFTVYQADCTDDPSKCSKTATPTSGKLCPGAATVADLSEHEINLKCELFKDLEIKRQGHLRLNEQHLAGKLCVVTSTHIIKNVEGVNNFTIKAGACGKDGNEYRLELSFALDK